MTSSSGLHQSPLLRRLFIVLGFLALLLGLLGVFLPILPTTPFILLAAFCFGKGSARFHQWLLNHHLTGPLIKDWYEHQSLRPRVKRWVYLFVVLSFSTSVMLVQATWLKLSLAGLGLLLLIVLWRIPVRDENQPTP
jgi:uncharacterized membrane protein YbaN (DUF454 family)